MSKKLQLQNANLHARLRGRVLDARVADLTTLIKKYAGDPDWNTYLTLSTSAVARRVEIAQLALAWSEQKSALQSLLGTELSTFPTPEPQR